MSERDAARELLRELLHDALANSDGDHATVPPPPVAAVHRPSTWSRPAAPGEVIGDGTTPSRTELVRLDDDDDLAAFVHALLDRAAVDGPAIRDGRLRFTLGRATTGAGGPPATSSGVMRIEHGAVTERTVKTAADAGARLVLAPGAVLTPLAREKARALGIEIERERRC